MRITVLFQVVNLIILYFPFKVYSWSTVGPTPVTWPREMMPIPFEIAEPGSEDLGGIEGTERIVKAAFKTWENVKCAHISFEYKGRISKPRLNLYDGHNVIAWRDDYWPKEIGNAIAITRTKKDWLRNRIIEGDIELNGVSWKWTSRHQPPDTFEPIDAQALLVHEIGHFIGIGHTTVERSAMFRMPYRSYRGERTLSSDDIEAVCSLYPRELCTTDKDCPEGTCCRGGRCLSGEEMVEIFCKPCGSMADCGAPENACLRGFADGRSYCGVWCNTDADCKEGFECVRVGGWDYFQCVPPGLDCRPYLPRRCSTDTDCSPGESCVCNICAKLKKFGENCESAWDCKTGVCIDTERGRICSQSCKWPFHEGCPQGYQCSFQDCEASVCIPGQKGSRQLDQSCNKDEDCASLLCFNKRCARPCRRGEKKTCLSNESCYPIKGDCGVCKKALPLGAECKEDFECSSQHCIAFKVKRFCAQKCELDIDCQGGYKCRKYDRERSFCIPESLIEEVEPSKTQFKKELQPRGFSGGGLACNLQLVKESPWLLVFVLFGLSLILLRSRRLFLLLVFIPSILQAYQFIWRWSPTTARNGIRYWINRNGARGLGYSKTAEIIQRAFQTWEDVTCSYLNFTYMGPITISPFNLQRDGRVTISWSNSDAELPQEYRILKSVLGVTYPSGWSGGVVTDVDIWFNATYYTWVDRDVGPGRRVDLEGIAIHEIGHLLGLGHSDKFDATMSPSSRGIIRNRLLSTDDIAGLCALYPSGNTCSSDADCPPNWFCRGIGCIPGRKGLCEECYDDNEECGGPHDACIAGFPDGKKYCGKACFGDKDCPSGYICLPVSYDYDMSEYQCVPEDFNCSSCSNDRQCPAGLKCVGQKCVPKASLGEECSSNEDCLSGFCLKTDTGTYCSKRCYHFLDCAQEGYFCGPLTCSQGACMKGTVGLKKDGEICKTHTDCASLYCLLQGTTKVCTRRCKSTEDCISGFECKTIDSGCNVCVRSAKKDLGEECQEDKDCASNLCVSGICTRECNERDPCPSGYICWGQEASEARYCVLEVSDWQPPLKPKVEKPSPTPTGCECNITKKESKYMWLIGVLIIILFLRIRPKRLLKLFSFGVIFILLGCAEEKPPRILVQPNIVDKTVFEGSWYYLSTVIDVKYDAMPFSFPGDTAYDVAGGIYTLPRIRWVIDRDFLYAFRDYELTQGANPEAKKKDFLGEPVLAFRIESHFDIKRSYNPTTGEEQEIIEENTSDRRWYERRFMRVDWSQNLITSYDYTTGQLQEMLGKYKKEPTPLFVQEGSSYPKDWYPQFEFSEKGSKEAEEYGEGTLYYMSFVTQEIYTPADVKDPVTGKVVPWCKSSYLNVPNCSSNLVTFRHSFLKVPQAREYAPLNYSDVRFNRFGFFRLGTPTYTPAYGETDFLNYNILRQNIFKTHFNSQTQEELDPREKVKLGKRELIYYLTPDFPLHLIRPAFEVVAKWNEVFMEMMRELKGAKVPKDYDPFSQPKPGGYDCWIASSQDAANPVIAKDPEDPKTEEDFKEALYLSFQGKECVIRLFVNPCQRDPSLACKLQGDLRYNFLGYIQVPGLPFLGIATLRADPVTGEIIHGDAYVSGGLLQEYRTFALQQYDLAAGNIDELDLLSGEEIRDYLSGLGKVVSPAIPVFEFGTGKLPLSLKTWDFIQEGMQDLMDSRIELLKGAEGRSRIFSDRLYNLRGTEFEQRLLDRDDLFILEGLNLKEKVLSEVLLDKVSPFRRSFEERLLEQRNLLLKFDLHNVTMDYGLLNGAVLRFVKEHEGLSRQKLVFEIERFLFKKILMHEFGHLMGLRHNFAASVDYKNFREKYHQIVRANPLPSLEGCLEGLCSMNEAREIAKRQEEVFRKRQELGIEGYMSSSVMDYFPRWYTGVLEPGLYDRAAIKFGYGNLVEVFDPTKALVDSWGERLPVEASRRLWVYYQGGEVCKKDQDCPYHKGSGRLISGQGIGQRCISLDEGLTTSGICSNIYDDLSLPGGYEPVEYLFCSDERAGDISWCNRFDQGVSFTEIVRNLRNWYHEDYIFRNFRRYRRNFDPKRYALFVKGILFGTLAKIYQHMFFRYKFEPGFREDKGPLGLMDQYLASVGILNFFVEVVTQPDIAPHFYNRFKNTYYRTGFISEASQDLSHRDLVGLGKYLTSVYQRGISGIERLERIGVTNDKLWALEVLSRRDFGLPYTIDERYFINFYDLFPRELVMFFSGILKDEPSEYGPRWNQAEGELIYLDFWLGACSFLGAKNRPCRQDPREVFSEIPAIDPGSSKLIRTWAAIYGLSQFPVFFDTTFEHLLYLFVAGSGDKLDILDGMEEGRDFVRYESDRFSKVYVAFQVDLGGGPGQKSITFEMVREAEALKERREYLLSRIRTGFIPPGFENWPEVYMELRRVESRLNDYEAFFIQLIELQRLLKIAGYIKY